jgi:hypothetical protein
MLAHGRFDHHGGQRSRSLRWTTLVSVLAISALGACGDDESSDGANAGGSSGSGGTAGSAGKAGSGAGGTGGQGAASTGGSGGGSGGSGATGGAATGGAGGGDGGPAQSCANPGADWLYCEDFERGAGDFDTWFAGSEFLESPGSDDRGRVTLASDSTHSGSFALFMPAAASSGHQGASLDWYACDGAPQANCPLRSFDTLYFRVWLQFAPDHRYIHHFLSISGSQPDDFWFHGSAGCMPNGSLEMGTTVDYHEDSHESFFYTYFPGMGCDTNCGNYADVAAICADCASKGLPTCDSQQQCCWGNNYDPPTPKPFPIGSWFCLEMMMQANTPGSADGVQEYWIDGQPGHRVDGMQWRTSPTLALNRVRLQHYIESSDAGGHSNRVWFDDMVVSTSRIGCN